MKISTSRAAPLEIVTVGQLAGASVAVCDGEGREYVRMETPGKDSVTFTVAGALGPHMVFQEDDAGRITDSASFHLACQTHITDQPSPSCAPSDGPGGGHFASLLRNLHMTMLGSFGAHGATHAEIGEKRYKYFVCWLRDHTHTLKGMKYFDGELKTGFELYADTQRADGMVYDRIAPKADVQGWRDYTFRKGDFITTVNPGTLRSATLQRIPVENDVEFLLVECLYYTWRATGDTDWMARYLDPCRRAIAYATSDEYRWSKRFGLLKRGYTIDTWDFMHDDDTALTPGDNVVDLEKTTFGIMHGDNTGMAASCRYLAEMLRAAGRSNEAPEYDSLADDLLTRLEKTAWTGNFYKHHISEDPSFKRDVGDTDEDAQISLSNAYSLNRGIGADKCKAIIETYQRIRGQMPPASPGEFYNIYPPFEKGFGSQNTIWQYMNGGVSTIVAGELAHGAFENGFEEYGIDILTRVKALADRHGGRLHVCFNGNPQTEPPERAFSALALGKQANITSVWREEGGWGDPGNDLSRMPTGEVEFLGIPFRVRKEGRGLGIARNRKGFSRELRIPVGARHASMYLLHTAADADNPIGELEALYSDGARHHQYISAGAQLENWFMPGATEGRRSREAPRLDKGWPEHQIAWRGENDTYENVGLFLWGWDNPHPEKEIAELVFRAAENDGAWFVPGITFSDCPVWFPQSDVSFGIPDCWGSAAIVYALIEGLAGIKNTGIAFDSALLCPRWSAAGINKVSAAAVYPASGGYVAYDYALTGNTLSLRFASNAERIACRILLPKGKHAIALRLNGMESDFTIERAENSFYACVQSEGIAAHEIGVVME